MAVAGTDYDAPGAAATAQGNSLQKSSNLSDLASASTARTNLGLGTAATASASAFDAAGAAAAAQAASLPLSGGTMTGQLIGTTLLERVIAGVGHSDRYPGATVDVRVNACIADALNLANGNTTGICDASAETGSLTSAAQINVGNSAGAPLTLLIPCSGEWVGTMTDGTSSILLHYGGSSIISGCPSSGLDGGFRIRPGASSSLGYIYATAPAGNNQQSSYYYVKGLNIYNHSGVGHATASGIGAYIVSPSFDGSLWTETDVFDDLDAQPAVVHGGCCSSTWTHSSISGNYSGTPLTLLTDSSAGAGVVSFDFAYMTVVHPGPGLPVILCTDSAAHTSVANFDHIYTETSNTDTTTGLYKVDGCGTVSFNHIAFRSETAGISSPGIVVTTTYNSNVHVEDVTFTNGSGSFLLPAKAVQNNNVPAALNQVTDSLGHYGLYTNAPSAIGILNQQLMDGGTTALQNLGTGAAASNFVSISGGRGSVGFDDTNGVTTVQGGSGKGVRVNVNNGTFGSGVAVGWTNSGVEYHVIGSAIASAATTTITPPAGCTTTGLGCQVVLIPDAAWTTATGGNIAAATTAVAGKALTLIYDPSKTLWYPSY